MSSKNLRQIKGTKENPFTKDLVDKFNVTVKREYIKSDSKGVQQLIIDKDGEVIGENRFFRIKEVDDEKFAKLFVSKMKMMWDIPGPASRVYTYILSNLPISSDQIMLFTEEVQEWCNYKSQSSIWKGIKWLVDNDFIAKSYYPNMYWINPTFIFNGDRVAFVDMIVKEKKGQDTKELT